MTVSFPPSGLPGTSTPPVPAIEPRPTGLPGTGPYPIPAILPERPEGELPATPSAPPSVRPRPGERDTPVGRVEGLALSTLLRGFAAVEGALRTPGRPEVEGHALASVLGGKVRIDADQVAREDRTFAKALTKLSKDLEPLEKRADFLADRLTQRGLTERAKVGLGVELTALRAFLGGADGVRREVERIDAGFAGQRPVVNHPDRILRSVLEAVAAGPAGLRTRLEGVKLEGKAASAPENRDRTFIEREVLGQLIKTFAPLERRAEALDR